MPRPIRRRRWPQWVGALLTVVLVVIGWRWEQQMYHSSPMPPASGGLAAGEYEVLRVVDGDTLLLKQDRTRVRLQGIDTPETVKENSPVESWGKEASQYTKTFIAQAGWRVRLEFDGEPTDRHGRTLAFVWHKGRLLNEELVWQGLAPAKLHYAYSSALKKRLREAQDDARANRRGIWSSSKGASY
ncbi:MAG: thermonuclease family protein [Pirellulales bacterium]|nr:thermonuclease family protein [Pirellulales bacterium]